MARILVVDDSIENLTLIEVYLRGTEFEVVTASGGQEALELCREGRFDLILLDVVMPDVDGFEVCRRLKNDAATAFLPVIFLTARLVDESEKAAAYQLGAVDYIQKPVHREELLGRVRVMLRMEQVRSRLDRENTVLRDEVGALGRSLAAARREGEDLRALRRAIADGGAVGVLLLDGNGTLIAADAAVGGMLGELAVGAPLAQGGLAAARLARLVAEGAQAAELALPQADRGARTLEVVIRRLPGGPCCVLLRDVTAVLAVAAHVRSREPAQVAPAAAGIGGEYAMTDFVGSSPAVREIARMVDRLRNSRCTVLIHGESGTGKEVVARALHFDGKNRSAPFIPIHCGAIAPELVESELFGHEKGAFTGAQQSRDGLFRAADGGTIFLDEVAEMSLAIQVKLLRVLQRGEIRSVGSNQPRIVDVRVISATNKDLARMVREGRFREDLYHRLQVVELQLPPLRRRIEDLPALIEHFLEHGNRRHDRAGRPVRGISRGALDRLLAHTWPGNVRELEHAIERAFALGVGEVLQDEDLPEDMGTGFGVGGVHASGNDDELPDLRAMRRTAERQAMLQALRDAGGDKLAAARALGLPRSTFYRRLRQLGL